jgi:methyl coenzyme M reductase gamma subunit
MQRSWNTFYTTFTTSVYQSGYYFSRYRAVGPSASAAGRMIVERRRDVLELARLLTVAKSVDDARRALVGARAIRDSGSLRRRGETEELSIMLSSDDRRSTIFLPL